MTISSGSQRRTQREREGSSTRRTSHVPWRGLLYLPVSKQYLFPSHFPSLGGSQDPADSKMTLVCLGGTALSKFLWQFVTATKSPPVSRTPIEAGVISVLSLLDLRRLRGPHRTGAEGPRPFLSYRGCLSLKFSLSSNLSISVSLSPPTHWHAEKLLYTYPWGQGRGADSG